MLVSCQGSSFANAIQIVSKAITGKKIGNPILECIKIEANEYNLVLTATDGEFSIEKKIKAEVFTQGVAVLNYKLISEFVSKLTADEVTLKLNEDLLVITYGDNSCSFACYNSDEFPNIEIVDREHYLRIKSSTFIDMVTRTLYAASLEDTRPILKGCLLTVDGDRLVMVALDGYRMAVYGVNEFYCNGDLKMILPQRSLNEIIKIINNDDEPVNIYFSNDKVMIDLEHTVVISRLIKGTYVEYKGIIVKNFETIVTFRREDLKNALTRVMVISKTTKGNVVDFEIKEDKMYLRSKGDINGDIVEHINITNEGRVVDIAFNAKNIFDVINYNNDEVMRMFIRNGDSACVIKAEGSEENLNLILPIKRRRV